MKEPIDEWRAELEETAGYETRQVLDRRWFESNDPDDFAEFNRWTRRVTWPAELAVWKKASDWYENLLEGMSPRRLRALPQVAIRCRPRGCLLGKVYNISLEYGQRVYFRGTTSSGKKKHGVCNWTFADSFDGLSRWWQVGCKHGHVILDCHDLVEVMYEPELPARETWEALQSQSNESQMNYYREVFTAGSAIHPLDHRVAWRTGVYHPPQERWVPRGGGRSRHARVHGDSRISSPSRRSVSGCQGPRTRSPGDGCQERDPERG